MLFTLTVLLAAAVLLVPLTRRFGLGSVLGYLVGGALIGPSGLRLVTDVQAIADVSELGVVMLLFLIGLEVRPQRLWLMRRAVFGLGSAQVVVTALILAGCLFLAGVAAGSASIVLGAGLALSSTAIVLPMLGERDLLEAPAGRTSFAVLLFQDLSFVPLVAAVPLLAGSGLPTGIPWHQAGVAVLAIGLILLGGRFLLRPVFRAIGGTKTPELFTALALLVVVGTAALAHAAGLSTSLGAFLAGVLLSDSEYRHEVKATIDPFEGLLLGFFFLSVGMAADLGLAAREPLFFVLAVPAFILVKAGTAFGLARIAGNDPITATRFSLALSQGSEFSFVLFAAATTAGALDPALGSRATLAIALSMAATPLLFAASEKALVPRLKTKPVRPFDPIDDEGAPVIICGFGRMGQVVGRIMRMRGIGFTALELDTEQLDVVRRFGQRIFYGDPTRLETLRAAGADRAKLMVVTLGDVTQSLAAVDVARRNFPDLPLVVRARNRQHAYLLMDRGVTTIIRETFHSSLELSALALQAAGVPAAEAERTVALFADYDARRLVETHAFYTDERQLIQSARQTADELADLLANDQAGGLSTADEPVRPGPTKS